MGGISMNSFFIKIASLLGVFGKAREFLKGKKTIISSVIGMLGSGSAVLVLLLSWIDGKIDMNVFLDQVKIPAGAFWVSATFLFSSFHPKNIAEGN